MAYFWDTDIIEVSLVKKPANRRRFILLKREEADMPDTKMTPEQEKELEKEFNLDKWIREVKDIVSSLADKLDEFVGKDKVESLPADIKSLLVSLKETLGVGAYPYPYSRGPYPYPYARGAYPYPYARKAEEKEAEQVKEETQPTETSEPAQPKETEPAATANTTPEKEKEETNESISKEAEERLLEIIDKLSAQIEQLAKLLGGEG